MEWGLAVAGGIRGPKLGGLYSDCCRTASWRARWPLSRQKVRVRQRVHSQGKKPRIGSSRSCVHPLRFRRRRWSEPHSLQTLLLNGLTSSCDWHPLEGVPFLWPHARWSRSEGDRSLRSGEPGLIAPLLVHRRLCVCSPAPSIPQAERVITRSCSGRLYRDTRRNRLFSQRRRGGVLYTLREPKYPCTLRQLPGQSFRTHAVRVTQKESHRRLEQWQQLMRR